MEILNQNCSFIKVTSALLVSALTPDPTTYDTLTVTAVINCCSGTFSEDITEIETDTYKIEGTDLYLKPAFFGVEVFQDGVYSIKVSVIEDDETSVDDNCAFVDCSFKCKFSDKIEAMLSEGNSTEKQQAFEFTMLHYALTMGSNCGCNCNDLCGLYKQLYKVTYGINLPGYTTQSSQTSDCGCY